MNFKLWCGTCLKEMKYEPLILRSFKEVRVFKCEKCDQKTIIHIPKDEEVDS